MRGISCLAWAGQFLRKDSIQVSATVRPITHLSKSSVYVTRQDTWCVFRVFRMKAAALHALSALRNSPNYPSEDKLPLTPTYALTRLFLECQDTYFAHNSGKAPRRCHPWSPKHSNGSLPMVRRVGDQRVPENNINWNYLSRFTTSRQQMSHFPLCGYQWALKRTKRPERKANRLHFVQWLRIRGDVPPFTVSPRYSAKLRTTHLHCIYRSLRTIKRGPKRS
jgi:hypothetical protein